jgi:preprotein translocase subunit SecD
MHRIAIWTACITAFLFVGIADAHAQFSIRAASGEPVDGWQRMKLEYSEKTVWVSPIAAVVASDIEKAQPEIRADGDTVIRVVFTEAGAEKIRDLTTAQLRDLIALVVDDKLIWAPTVQAATTGKETILTGSGPHGLSQEDVELIMSSLGYVLSNPH